MAERYCAKIEDNVVVQVIVCGDVEWAARALGGEWVYTGEQLVSRGWLVVDGEIVRPEPEPFLDVE